MMKKLLIAINTPGSLTFIISPIIAAIINHNNYLLNLNFVRKDKYSTLCHLGGSQIHWQPFQESCLRLLTYQGQ